MKIRGKSDGATGAEGLISASENIFFRLLNSFRLRLFYLIN
jgi:hypothetical protein